MSHLGLVLAGQRPGISPPPLLLILAVGSLAKVGGLSLDRSEDRVRAGERLAHLGRRSNCTLDDAHGLSYREGHNPKATRSRLFAQFFAQDFYFRVAQDPLDSQQRYEFRQRSKKTRVLGLRFRLLGYRLLNVRHIRLGSW